MRAGPRSCHLRDEPKAIWSFAGVSSAAHELRWNAKPLTRSGFERVHSALIECRHTALHVPLACVIHAALLTLKSIVGSLISCRVLPQERRQENENAAKGIASKQCGIAEEKILVASTHTHTALPSNVTQGQAPAVEYRKLLVAGIAESIVRAHAGLRPAGVSAAASALPEEVFCRRWFLKPGSVSAVHAATVFRFLRVWPRRKPGSPPR